MRDLRHQAEELKDTLRDAEAMVEKHKRLVTCATKRRDLAVRLALAFVSRSQRLLAKKKKRPNAWMNKHVCKLEELEARATIAENSLERAELELACADMKFEEVVVAMKSAAAKIRMCILAEKK